MNQNELGFHTKLVHSGEPVPRIGKALVMPVFQSSSFEHTVDSLGNDQGPILYSRLSNTPNHLCVGKKLAAIEGAEAGVVTASGMAAISTALLALVPEGGHLLAQDTLYGGTFHFLTQAFSKLGRKVSFFPLEESGDLEKWIQPETKAIYVEAVSNPLMRLPDFPNIVATAKRHGLLTFIDNTFPSPFNFNPIALGFDVVLHSATKYLNGHTDVVGGCAIGSQALVNQVTMMLCTLGGCMDPHACFLLNRGLKTLGVRVSWQNESAAQLAKALEAHPRVERIFYPGLASHPDWARAKKWFRGYGGMLSFEFRGKGSEVDSFFQKLSLAVSAPSLGGVESLVTRPVKTSHSIVPEAERLRLGIKDTLVRVSVGLEDPADLIQDFVSALDRS